MTKLIIIRGNSGSGKSTLAKNLQKKLGRNTLVISHDVVRRDMLWVLDGKDNQALPLLDTLLRYGKEHCNYVILEGILDSSCYRPLFETAIELYGSEIYAYYYDIPFEETLKRHETKPNHMDFGKDEMQRWWIEKDYIGIISEKRLTKELELETAAKMIYQDLMG